MTGTFEQNVRALHARIAELEAELRRIAALREPNRLEAQGIALAALGDPDGDTASDECPTCQCESKTCPSEGWCGWCGCDNRSCIDAWHPWNVPRSSGNSLRGRDDV